MLQTIEEDATFTFGASEVVMSELDEAVEAAAVSAVTAQCTVDGCSNTECHALQLCAVVLQLCACSASAAEAAALPLLKLQLFRC